MYEAEIEQKHWPEGMPPRRQFQEREQIPQTPKGFRDAMNMGAPPLTPHSPTISSRPPMSPVRGLPMSPLRTPSSPPHNPHAASPPHTPHTPHAAYLGTPQSSSRPMLSARPSARAMPRTPLTTARSSSEAREMRGGTPFATPRTPISTTRVSELPWNQPPPPLEPESALDSMMKSLTNWWTDTFGTGEPKKKAKRRKLPKKYDPSEDTRPPWDPLTNKAPLTGAAGPPAVVFHRAPQRPWDDGLDDNHTAEPSATSAQPSDSLGAVAQKAKPTGRVTKSPSGRSHPSKERRHQIRESELMNSIAYFDQASGSSGTKLLGVSAKDSDQLGGYIGKDATRYMASSGWIPAQAWSESLRFYPLAEEAEPYGDSVVALSGQTHSISNAPQNHLEMDVRTRAGIATADPEWRAEQLPLTWAPRIIPNHLKDRLDRTVEQLLTARETTHDAASKRSTPAPVRRAVHAKPWRSDTRRRADMEREVRL